MQNILLHAKYFEVYNNILLLRARADQHKKNIRHSRYEYFTGKADPEVYIEEPFGKKIRDKETMQKYLDADEKLSNAGLKVQYYDVMIKYLEDIILFLVWSNAFSPMLGAFRSINRSTWMA